MAFDRTLVAIFVALVIAAGQANAEGVFKWVDSNGQTHFGGTPPTGKKADKLSIPSAPTQPANAEGGKDWQEQLRLSNQRRQLARDKDQEAAKRQQESDQRCLAARRSLDTLSRQRPLYRVNAQGEREYLEDGQRQADRDAASQRVATYCRN